MDDLNLSEAPPHGGFYDRNGQPLSLMEWGTLFENMEYRRVTQDTLENGIYISTVWLGVGYEWRPENPPLIFETMVWNETGEDIGMYRHSTEVEARECHKKLVKKYSPTRKLP